jgi:hypothetical protein
MRQSFSVPATQPTADETPNNTREPEEEKPSEPEAPEDVEANYVEDDTNAANDIRRKLWRLHTALKFIDPTDRNIQIVDSVVWRLRASPSAFKTALCAVMICPTNARALSLGIARPFCSTQRVDFTMSNSPAYAAVASLVDPTTLDAIHASTSHRR